MTGFHAFDVMFAGDDANGLPGNALRNTLMPVLHHAFMRCPKTFALALMHEQAGVRLFAQDANATALSSLADTLTAAHLVRDYGRISPPAPVVATECDIAWVAFRRYRLPTERSDRNAGPEGSALRARRLAEARRLRLPYVEMASSSSGSRFRLTVAPQLRSVATAGIFDPDGYGLASATRDFAVPIQGPLTLFLRGGSSP